MTADDIQRVAKKYLTLDNIQIVAVGDATKIKGPSREVRQNYESTTWMEKAT